MNATRGILFTAVGCSSSNNTCANGLNGGEQDCHRLTLKCQTLVKSFINLMHLFLKIFFKHHLKIRQLENVNYLTGTSFII